SGAGLEQLLAEVGYLPLTWAPSTGSALSLADAHAQLRAAYQPPVGTYTWQPGYPPQLMKLWRPDKPSLILKGAVMAFEADHGLALDGVIGREVWRGVVRAGGAGPMEQPGDKKALPPPRVPTQTTASDNRLRRR